MRRSLVLGALALVLPVPAYSQGPVPGEVWMRYADPAQAGWTIEELEEARAYWHSLDSAAWMVVENGVVVVAWGDVERRYMCHSVRKSFLSGLIGLHVDTGTLDTEKTMADLGIDDEPQLTDVEKTARIEDLLRARSGVYRLAAYEPPQNPKPPRGSHAPGTNWVYNNWDFNTLCTIFEQETGKKLFEEFGSRIAGPLGMQDWRVRDGYYHYELDKSIHPAYPFRLSARDSARFGLLFLNGGQWGAERVLSEAWVKRSTASYSDTGGGGYGYMWWVAGDPRVAETGMYSAQGVGGQQIAVLPEAGLVIVNRTDTYMGENVPEEQRTRLIRMILDARDGEPGDDIELVPLESEARGDVPTLEPAAIAELVGSYRMTGMDLDFTVRAEGRTLLLDTPSPGVFGMTPVEGDTFFVEDVDSYLLFEKRANGEKGSLVWEWGLLRRFGALLEGGDQDAALATAERMIELFPMSATSHWAMALGISATGDPVLARDLCDEALRLDPANTYAQDLREELGGR